MVSRNSFSELGKLARWSQLSASTRRTTCLSILRQYNEGTRDPTAIAALAVALANSGETLKWPKALRPIGDVTSTGGPSSLSTLLCPYILGACGVFVPNVTVPGSLAGAVDVLSLVQSYRTDLDYPAMSNILKVSNVVHALTSPAIAPADGYLFHMRSRLGKKAVPALVIASLLSKKLAVSNPTCSVDVRCGQLGNLGATSNECQENAALFVQVAGVLEVNVRCVVTDINNPQMPLLGRGESLYALDAALTLKSKDAWLSEHVETCLQIASEALLACGIATDQTQALAMAKEALDTGAAAKVFLSNLTAQGSSQLALSVVLEEYQLSQRVEVKSPKSGFVIGVDTKTLSEAIIVTNGKTSDEKNVLGLMCLKQCGDHVSKGEPIVAIRHAPHVKEDEVALVRSAVRSAYRIGPSPVVDHRPQVLNLVY